LLTKLASATEGKIDLIPMFFAKSEKRKAGVSQIVEAFIHREVDKWKERDTQTGKAYLSFDQHMKFLSEVALAMWESKRDHVSLEEIEYYSALLLSDWSIEETLKPIIMRMVKTHAFLIPPANSRFDLRKFDHEEFKNYFLSRALAELIDNSLEKSSFIKLKQFLYIDQLPDSVAMYCFNYVTNLNENVNEIIAFFKRMVEEEYKPTYLQMNVGTLFPFLIDKISFDHPILFDSKVTYSSLIFENKSLKNITFENGSFINISLRNTHLENVHFKKCTFNEIKIEHGTNNAFLNVSLEDYQVNSILIMKDGEIHEIAYSPERIRELLLANGIRIEDYVVQDESIIAQLLERENEFKKLFTRFLFKFNKMTIQYERNIEKDKYLGSNTELLFEEIIPLAMDYGVIVEVENKQTQRAQSRAWRLTVQIEELLQFDGSENDQPLSKFWQIINSREQ
jgi:hypothetical protein